MTTSFTYSVLQYRHSLVLGEAINVGILFHFPVQEKLDFVAGNPQRLKAIYPDFDLTVYNYQIRHIERKLKDDFHSFFNFWSTKKEIKKYISGSLLADDASVLQFQDPVSVVNTKVASDDFIAHTITEFSQLLLPGISIKKPEIIRHNESFLIKRFIGYIFENHKELEKKFTKNSVLKTTIHNRDIEVKFDLLWQNGTTNLVKPLSFDLAEEKAIQDKSLFNYAYLFLLGDYAQQQNLRFDFIVSKPQNKELYSSYENALGLLELTNTPKRIVTERDLKEYSEETIEELLKH